MPLSPSWKTHFITGIDPLNVFGNRNFVKYSEAMEIQVTVYTKMTTTTSSSLQTKTS